MIANLILMLDRTRFNSQFMYLVISEKIPKKCWLTSNEFLNLPLAYRSPAIFFLSFNLRLFEKSPKSVQLDCKILLKTLKDNYKLDCNLSYSDI